MSIRISEIHVQNLGPIDTLSIKPGRFNLIYGKNEKGKTTLVEFLIRSLFRNAKEWKLRAVKGSGRVLVEGLGSNVESFSPSSQKKLDDFWDQSGKGLPIDFSRLLAVKGAELELSRSDGGADKSVLKNFMSGSDILDKIQNPKNISKTIQNARIENGVIAGDKKGELDRKTQLQELLKNLDVLFVQLDRGYSGGRRKALSDLREKIKTELDLHEKAKGYRAYRIDEDIKTLEKEKNRIDEDKLKKLQQKLHLFQQKTVETKRKRDKQSTVEKRSEHYEWLKNASVRYRELANQTAVRPKSIFPILTLGFILVSMVLILFKWPIPSAIALAIALVMGFLTIRQLQTIAGRTLHYDELDGMKQEFQSRLKQKWSGLSALEEVLQKIEPDFSESRILKKQLGEDVREIERLQHDIGLLFSELNVNAGVPSEWNGAIRKYEEKLRSIREGIEEKRISLAALGVDSTNYVSQPPEAEWDAHRYEEAKKKLSSAEKELEDNVRKLDSLKQLICAQTGDEITVAWPALIQNLKTKRERVVEAYQNIHAEIIGKVALMQVLETMRKGEDGQIQEGLNSKTVLDALQKTTGRYSGLHLDGDTLLVSDPYREYPLADLSTGAQEQVLLALRIGFASKLLKQDRLFLIFDDAFQYSDWERRTHLLDTVADLAERGWQILYFTMDDHIRDLFDKKGKTFGKEYVRVELK